jgi:hypothetical protein
MTTTFSKVARSYPKHNEINPDSIHSNYAKWQQEKFGNVLEDSDEEPEDNEFYLSDLLNND